MKSLLISLLVCSLSFSQLWAQVPVGPPLDYTWIPNGGVSSIVPCADKVILSGNYDWIGPDSGAGIVVDKNTLAVDNGYPIINGDVSAVIPDGAGGWYVGGDFNYVGSVAIRNLVHIKADKTVDESWKPNPTSGISAMVLSGTMLYVGGSFSTIAGQPRGYVASFDNHVLTAWNPNCTNMVEAIALSSDGRVFIGGRFSTVGGISRRSVAAVDAITGVVDSWNPNLLPSGSAGIRDIVISGSTVYLGGFFTSAGGPTRNNIAAVSLTTAAATSWNPNASSIVERIILDGTTAYLSGGFNTVGGLPRARVAAVSLTTGVPTAFNANVAGGYGYDINLSGSTLYLGGTFSSVNGDATIHDFVTLDKTTGAVIPGTNFDMSGGCFAFAIDGSQLFIGGYFAFLKGITGEYRNGLIALDTTTHLPAVWDPGLSLQGSAYEFHCANDTLYAFEKTTSNLFAINTTDGAVIPEWAPVVDGNITSWAFGLDGIYLHGNFSTINGDDRPLLGAVDYHTGATLPWIPNTSSDSFTATAMDVRGDVLYLGGDIPSLGGEGRGNLGAISTVTGEILPWAPDIQNSGALVISGITTSKTHAYIYGSFNQINGETRSLVTRVKLSDGSTDEWIPDMSDYLSVICVHLRGNSIFMGVDLEYPDPSVIAVNKTTGQDKGWDAGIGGVEGSSVVSVASIGQKIYISGNFDTGTNRDNFIVFNIAPPILNEVPVIQTTFQSVQIDGQVNFYLPDLISDPDDNVDFATLEIVTGPISGASAFIDGDYFLTVQYEDVKFSGTERLTIKVCDQEGDCTTEEITIEVVGDVVVYNALSPNGDGQNEIFYLQYIDILPDAQKNKVTIFDRWGGVVFEASNYDNNTQVFRGIDKKGEQLPKGTYYYKIDFESSLETKTGFLSLK